MSQDRLEFGDHGEQEDDAIGAPPGSPVVVATILDEWTDDREDGALGFRLVTTDQGDIWLDMRVQDEDGEWSEWAEEDLDGPGANVLGRIPTLLVQDREAARKWRALMEADAEQLDPEHVAFIERATAAIAEGEEELRLLRAWESARRSVAVCEEKCRTIDADPARILLGMAMADRAERATWEALCAFRARQRAQK